MQILGIAHTVISVAALVVAAISLVRHQSVRPFSKSGNWYSVLTAIACISAFGLSKTGHFTPGHALGILILLLLAIAYLLGKKSAKISQCVTLFCMTTTVFLSLVPGINETLTRLPVGHPIADGPTSPLVTNSLKVLLVVYVIGFILQCRQLRNKLKNKH